MKAARKEPIHPRRFLRLHPALGALLLVVVFLWGSACSARKPPEHVPGPSRFTQALRNQKILNPSTTMPNGSWLGGDVAASIPVEDDRRIWLFGDTLVGTFATDCPAPLSYCNREMAKGKPSGPVHNSVGVLRGQPGSYSAIERFWGTQDSGDPTSFFPAGKPDHYLWPLSGVSLEEGLIILANENSKTSGLSPVGAVLIHVRNPADPPPQWNMRQKSMPFQASTPKDRRSMNLTSSIVRQGDFLITIGSRRNAAGVPESVLARIPVAALENFDQDWAWEGWMTTGENTSAWTSPLEIDKLTVLEGLPGASEATYDQRPDGSWETYQIPVFSFKIHRFAAQSLEGPWQDKGAVYEVPVPWNLAPDRDCHRPVLRSARTRKDQTVRRLAAKDPLCSVGHFAAYAPKSHPGLSPHHGETLTYNVNLFFGNLRALVRAVEKYPGFYVPRVVTKP